MEYADIGLPVEVIEQFTVADHLQKGLGQLDEAAAIFLKGAGEIFIVLLEVGRIRPAFPCSTESRCDVIQYKCHLSPAELIFLIYFLPEWTRHGDSSLPDLP